MRKYTVEIKKTVQVKQFEPVTITLGCELEGTLMDRDHAYDELKKKMKSIFEPESCLD